MTVQSAIVLAAGRGARLGERTRRQAKCQIRLGGRTLLAWQLAALRSAGLGHVTVVAGYRAETLRTDSDTRLVANTDWQCSGPVASLCCADPQRYDAFLVVYADSLQHPRALRALRDAPGEIAFASDQRWHDLWSLRFGDVLADAECLRHDRGRLLRIGGRAAEVSEIQGQFAGLLKFSRAGWANAAQALDGLDPERRRTLDMTGLLALLLERGAHIDAVPIAGHWCEVDSDTDLALYRRLLRRKRWGHDWRWERETA
jgi:choline kinase